MNDPVSKMVAQMLVEAEANAAREHADCEALRAELKVADASIARLRVDLARVEGRLEQAIKRAERAEAKADQVPLPLPAPVIQQTVDIGPVLDAIEALARKAPAPFDLVPERDKQTNLLKRIAVVFK